jgi:hypothetical protein
VNNAIRNGKYLLALLLDDLGAQNTVAGTATAITVTAAEGWTAYGTGAGQIPNGTLLSIKAASTATGAATLNVNAIGAKAIRRQGDTAIQAGDWLANSTLLLRYDTAYNSAAGAWVLVSGIDPTTGLAATGQISGTSTAATTPALLATNTTNANTVIGLQLTGSRSTPAALDAIGMNYVLNNAAGTAKTVAQQFGILLTNTAGAEEGSVYWSLIKAGAAANIVRLTSAALEPVSNDLVPLGNGLRGWSDLFLATGGVINFANGDLSLTHSTKALTASADTGQAATPLRLGLSSTEGGSTWDTTALFASHDISSGDATGAGSGVRLRWGARMEGPLGSATSWVLQTAPTTAGTMVDRVVVSAAGVTALQFAATQVPSSDANTLDDYEETTWTPAFSATSSTFSYSSRSGNAVKVGQLVFENGTITLNSTGNTLAAQFLTITGLPYQAAATTMMPQWAIFGNLNLASTTFYPVVFPGLTTMQIYSTQAAAASAGQSLANNLSATAGSSLTWGGCYQAAA